LLKVLLSERCKPEDKTWIDCDDLTNLELLFGYVSSKTDTVVILMSRELLRRPWCMGELVTAHLNQPRVKMIPVRFPDFDEPDDVFVEEYGNIVTDIGKLGAHGISLAMVQDMLRWVREIPGISIPAQLGDAVCRELAKQIVGKSFAGKDLTSFVNVKSRQQPPPADANEKDGSQSTTTISSQGGESGGLNSKVPCVTDFSNMEGLATALVLCKLVRKMMTHDATMLPYLQPWDETLGDSTKTVIFVLANGVFMNSQFLNCLITAAELGARNVPIIAEDGFRFPSGAMLESLKKTLPTLTDLQRINEGAVDVDQLLGVIESIFAEIAIVFAPQDYSSSEALLQVKAKNVAQRLTSSEVKTLKLNEKKTKSKDAQTIPTDLEVDAFEVVAI
jgi:hypothetical protein